MPAARFRRFLAAAAPAAVVLAAALPTSAQGAARPGGDASSLARTLPFVDVTAEVGLDYVQSDPSVPATSSAVYMGGGGAAADADGDGWVDLYATRAREADVLFRNRGRAGRGAGHLGFEDVTAASFEDPPGTTGVSNAALFFDVENDGDLDLYVTNLFGLRYELWIQDAKGTFREEGRGRNAALETRYPHYGFSPAAGDYDRDGWLDLYVAEWGNSFVSPGQVASHARLLRNRGEDAPGCFEDVTDAAGVSIDHLMGTGPVGAFTGVFAFSPSFTDLDQDGWPDLAIASDFGTSRLFWNRGDGSFEDGTVLAGVGSDENGMGSALGDFDGDGDLDWFVSSIWDPESLCQTGACNWGDSGNRLYRYAGGRTFEDATDEAGVRDGAWGWGSAFLDFDNDGDLDLVHTNGVDFPFTSIESPYEHDATRLFVNDGTGVFAERAAAYGIRDHGSGKGLLTLDYDRDGDLDVFLVNNGATPILYRNDLGHRRAWLRVELRGTVSNRFGAGARVRVRTGSAAPLLRELRFGNHFLGQSEPALFFGLGKDAEATVLVEVTWPSGKTTVLEDVPPNRSILVTEGNVTPGATSSESTRPPRRRPSSR